MNPFSKIKAMLVSILLMVLNFFTAGIKGAAKSLKWVLVRLYHAAKWLPVRIYRTMKRKRDRYTVWLTILTLAIMLVVDPDSHLIQDLPFGAQAIATFVTMLRPIIAITLLHITRKMMFDYIDLGDIYTMIMTARDTKAAALFVIGVGLFVVGYAVIFALALL